MRFTSDMLSFARPLLMQQILLLCEGSPAIVGEDNAYWLAIGAVSTSYAPNILTCPDLPLNTPNLSLIIQPVIEPGQVWP